MQKHESIVKIISVILVSLAAFAVISDYYLNEKTKHLALNSNIKLEKKFQYPKWGEKLSTTEKLDKFVNTDINRIFSNYPGEINCYKNQNEGFCYLDNQFIAKINILNSLNQSQALNQTILDVAKDSKTELFKEEKKDDTIFHQTIGTDGITFSIPKNNNIIVIKNETLIDKLLFNKEVDTFKKFQLLLDELNKK